MKPPEIHGSWRAVVAVAVSTLALPFVITGCLWHTMKAGAVVHSRAPNLADILFWALPPFILLAILNASFVYAPRTRRQKSARPLAGTLGLTLPFIILEFASFSFVFHSDDVPPFATFQFASVSFISSICMLVALAFCRIADPILQWIRARRAGKSV